MDFIDNEDVEIKNFFKIFRKNHLTKGVKFGNIIFVNCGRAVVEDNENIRRRSKDVKR